MEIHCKNYREKKYSIGRDIHDFAQILQFSGNNSNVDIICEQMLLFKQKNYIIWQ